MRVSRTKKHSVRFGSLRLRAFYLVSLGVWISGGLWLLFHYFLTTQGEFGPQSNALEPWSLKIHGAFAFAATWFFGLLWGTHITVGWHSGRRRSSGAVLTGSISLLVVTGYLLYYVGDDRSRSFISIAHWGVGLICPLLYGVHRIRKRSAGKSTRNPDKAARGCIHEEYPQRS